MVTQNERSTRVPLRDRVLSRVRKVPSGCWEFMGARTNGYGVVGLGTRVQGDRRVRRAHRVMWELEYGEVPDGLLVCHRCDNRACVNPAHLFLGTHRDNTADMIAKGRKNQASVAGTANPRARLTEDQVREIRAELRRGVGPTELGKRYGVGHGTITSIKSGKNWSSIPW